jgi:predicted dehydrogenase
VVSCADPSADGRAYGRELFGPAARSHSDHRDMLADDLDGVFITTPDDIHVQPALDFLAAGVAVFVEKPLAITIEDCDRVLAAARAARTRLYVGHNLRHLPVLKAARDLIDQGAIGTVKAVWCRHFVGHGGDFYFKDWHADRRHTTSLLLQKGAHDLDVIHWLGGGSSTSVVAMGDLAVYGGNTRRVERGGAAGRLMPEWFDDKVWPPAALTGLNPVVDVEDISMMLARLDNGVLASYQQCHFTPDYWRNYTVIGDEGRLENFGDLDDATIKVWNKHRSGYRADADQTVVIEATEDDHGGADKALVGEFLRFAAEGGPTDTSPVAARNAVAAGVAATASLRAGGQPVEVPPLDPDVVAWFDRHQLSEDASQ